MILISDVRGTVRLDGGRLNTRLLEAYKIAAENGVKIYFFTNDGLSQYQAKADIKFLTKLVEEASAEKTLFFSDDGVVHLTSDGLKRDEREDLPVGFAKGYDRSYRNIKDYFPEESDFIFIDDTFIFLAVAENEGFKTIGATSQAPEELLAYINEKSGTELKLAEPKNILKTNQSDITSSDIKEEKKPNLFLRLFGKKGLF